MPKRLCVAAAIEYQDALVLGRRGKGPNRGMWVCPGGGVEDGESLEQALVRELKEETGLTINPYVTNRFARPIVIETDDRVILFVRAYVGSVEGLSASTDLDAVQLVSVELIRQQGGVLEPGDISEVCRGPLIEWGFYPWAYGELKRPEFGARP